MPPQQLCCRRVTRQRHKMSRCDTAAPHTARACRVHAPRRPFMARLAASSQLPAVHCCRRRLSSAPPCAGHCVLSAIIAAKEHAASVRKSRLRCFRRLPCCLPGADALIRTSRRSILDSQPQLPRAIAGRSCFAVRFCHVRRKACVAAPSMMYPAQQRVAHCVDDCFRMNTP